MKTKKTILIALILLIGFSFVLTAQEKTLPSKVDEYLSVYDQMRLFSGSVLIAKGENVLFKKSYGYANPAFGISNSPETKFRIGSLTKGFTAIAILQLVDQEKLHLDDPLSEFIPDYPHGDQIRLQNLLTHTSGIPNHTLFEDFSTSRRVYPFSPEQTINSFKYKKLDFTPSEQSAYSNSNYILLGFILEKVSGMSYENYIQQFILDPLKMKNTGFEHPERIIKQFATGTIIRNNELQNCLYRNMSNAHASGALYSTVEDLFRLDQALYSNTLLSKQSNELMLTPFKDSFTYGWGTANVFEHKMIGLAGEIDGFRANISRFVNDTLCIIILSNLENSPMNRINRDLITITFGKNYEAPVLEKTIALEDSIIKSYTGTYQLKEGFNFQIIADNERLFCEPTGQTKLELLAVSETEFMLTGVPAHIAFVKNNDNTIEKLILKQGGKEIPLLKIK